MKILLILLIHLYGFFLLMEGLFPYTKRLNIRSNQSCFDHLKNSSSNRKSRFILMIIDALRSDYVFNRNDSFHLKSIENLEKSRLCLTYQLKCHSPTVTLPRLKSILTGSIPSFWDVIYNYNTSQIDLDNLLDRYHESYPEKKIVFYGDETWLKLYPENIFSRFEALQSFFVTDFHQIDLNVTMNIRKEMNENVDWNLLIVHYLGLDHIGHALGAFHPFVQEKLNEYDEIIEEIVSKLNENDLLMITGDHGMIDQGGHGGATTKEILVPFILISKRFQISSNLETKEKKDFYQIDLTSTLSGLLQIAIPSNNLGIQIESILRKYFYEEKNEFFRCLSDDNERQLNQILHSSSSSSSLLSTELNSIEFIRDEAIRSSQQQNLVYIYLSLIIFILSSTLMFVDNLVNRFELISINLLIFSIEFIFIENLRLSFSLILIEYLLEQIYFNRRNFFDLFDRKFEKKTLSKRFELIYRCLTIVSLYSSSFIEEEHQIWYYFLSTFIFIRSIEEKSLDLIIQMIFIRFIRQWNQTGNKYLTQPDVKTFLQNSQNEIYLNFIDLISTGGFIYLLIKRNSSRLILFCPLIIFLIRSNFFSFIFSSSHREMLTTNAILLIYFLLFIELIRRRDQHLNLSFVYLLLIHRRHQSFLLFIYFLFSHLNRRKENSSLILLSQSAFFHLGNSNSFVTIDISTGFVGLTFYNPLIHGLFIYLSIYLISMIFFVEMSDENRRQREKDQIIFNVFYVFSMLIHRNHLFIWTVFAPKLFYQFAQTFSLMISSISSISN